MCTSDKSPRRRRAAFLCACALSLTACALGPNYKRPATPQPANYDSAPPPPKTAGQGAAAVVLQAGAEVAPRWWRAFAASGLDTLLDEAFARNPSLESAQASLRQSEAELRAGSGVFFPSLSLGLSAQRERSSPYRLGVPSAGAASGTVFSLFTLGASISYVIDIFGAQRRAVESLTAQKEAARQGLAAARLTLAGNLVNAAIAHAAYDEQIQIAQRVVVVRRRQLALGEAQAEAGILSQAALLGQRNALAAAQAALPPLQQKAAASAHLIASLSGRVPAEAQLPLPAWREWHLPASLPLSLPSRLVQQRPDILIAEARLHAASANLGVATANLFPSLSLSADKGLTNTQLSQLGNDSSRYWSGGPALNVPLFSGGADWAQREAAQAALQAALADYRQTVLGAFAQVADVLSSIVQGSEAAAARADALRASEEVYVLTQANVEAGSLGEADRLSAQLQLESDRSAFIDAQAQRLQDAVALYVALGGGWEAAGEEKAQAPQ